MLYVLEIDSLNRNHLMNLVGIVGELLVFSYSEVIDLIFKILQKNLGLATKK